MRKIVTTAIGAVLVIYMLLFSLFNNLNIGTLIPMAAGCIIAAWCFVPDNSIIRVLKRLFILGAAIYIAFIAFIAIMPETNGAEFDEDVVIVLGCGLHGSIPSRNLADRLEAAIEYNEKNPSALIVVSGGQGPQEDCSEAEAMYKYLVQRGINEDKIIMEDKSESTNENFSFSKRLLDERLGKVYKTVYITNSFHSYRAGRLALINGLEARSYRAATSLSSLLPNYCREVLAVIQLWVFKR